MLFCVVSNMQLRGMMSFTLVNAAFHCCSDMVAATTCSKSLKMEVPKILTLQKWQKSFKQHHRQEELKTRYTVFSQSLYGMF